MLLLPARFLSYVRRHTVSHGGVQDAVHDKNKNEQSVYVTSNGHSKHETTNNHRNAHSVADEKGDASHCMLDAAQVHERVPISGNGEQAEVPHCHVQRWPSEAVDQCRQHERNRVF